MESFKSFLQSWDDNWCFSRFKISVRFSSNLILLVNFSVIIDRAKKSVQCKVLNIIGLSRIAV